MAHFLKKYSQKVFLLLLLQIAYKFRKKPLAQAHIAKVNSTDLVV